MRKKIILTFAILVLILSSTGCLKKDKNIENQSGEAETEISYIDIPSDYFEVVLSDYNIQYSEYSMIAYTFFTFITIDPNISIVNAELDTNAAYEFDFTINEDPKIMNLNIFFTEQGIDWDAVAEKMQEGELFDEATEDYCLMWKEREVDKCNNLYIGTINVSFPDMKALKDDPVTKMSITLGDGRIFDYDIGKITYEETEDITVDGVVWCKTAGCVGNVFEKKHEQNMQLTDDGWVYYANADAEITGLYFYNSPEVMVDRVEVSKTTCDGKKINFTWDGKSSFEVEKGESLKLAIYANDPTLSGYGSKWVSRPLCLEYEAYGKKAVAFTDMCFYWEETDAYEYYLLKYEGIDMSTYYEMIGSIYVDIL